MELMYFTTSGQMNKTIQINGKNKNTVTINPADFKFLPIDHWFVSANITY